jgi:hypothetical protein
VPFGNLSVDLFFCLALIGKNQNAIFVALLFPFHTDERLVHSIYRHANIVSLNRQMPVEAAVDESQQFHLLWPAVVVERRQCGLYGPPGLEHIIHQNNFLAFHEEIQLSGAGRKRLSPGTEIIPVERDIQLAILHCRSTEQIFQPLVQAVPQKYATGLNPNEAGILKGTMLLNQLLTEPLYGQRKALLAYYDASFLHAKANIAVPGRIATISFTEYLSSGAKPF